MEPLLPDTSGINLYSEYSLHSQIKARLAGEGDKLEALVEGKVIDLVRANGELVEVQTKHLYQLKPKTLGLARRGYRVRIVHPVPVVKEIRRLDPDTGELQSIRKSPKRGDMYSLFDELVRASELIGAENITVEVIFIHALETVVRDGSGSWRRKGDKTIDRELLDILSSRSFGSRQDWLSLLPGDAAARWTSSSLGGELGIAPERARKMLYAFCRAGLLEEAGREGRSKLYARASVQEP